LAKAAADELNRQDPSIELVVVYKEPQDRLALFMNACDALIFPSYMEGSPNIVKQAMACNLPIVSTNVGDVREIIGATKGCYVCKPDVREFVERLADILRHRERTRGRGQVQHLAGPAVSQRIIKVYEQVLRNREMHAVNRATTNAKPQTNILGGK
jgi:teichuronic acid biosynthesis glycosyltransferase TuaC